MKWIIGLAIIAGIRLAAPMGHVSRVVPCDQVETEGTCDSGSDETPTE